MNVWVLETSVYSKGEKRTSWTPLSICKPSKKEADLFIDGIVEGGGTRKYYRAKKYTRQ